MQYLSVVLYMFNIYTGVQISFVDRRLNKFMACRRFGVKLEYLRIKCNLEFLFLIAIGPTV